MKQPLKQREEIKKINKKIFNWGEEGLVASKKDVFVDYLSSLKKNIAVLQDERSRNSFCNVLKNKKFIHVYDFCGHVDNCVFKFLSDIDWEKFLQVQSLNKKINCGILFYYFIG